MYCLGEEGDIDAAQLLMAKVENLQREKDEIVVRTLHHIFIPFYSILFCSLLLSFFFFLLLINFHFRYVCCDVLCVIGHLLQETDDSRRADRRREEMIGEGKR